jgi:hypothetical protein
MVLLRDVESKNRPQGPLNFEAAHKMLALVRERKKKMYPLVPNLKKSGK